MKKPPRLKLTARWRQDHWELTGIGFSRHARKVDAVADGVRMCRAHWATGQLAQLIIKGKDGRIQSERTYGADPRRSKG